MATLNQVANVLEKLAAYVDANEAQANTERQKKASARQAEIEALAVRYSAATGDEMPDAVRQKLANSDESVVALIGNIIENQFKGNARNWPFGSALGITLQVAFGVAFWFTGRRQEE